MRKEAALMLKIIRCFLDDKNAVYLSVPISSLSNIKKRMVLHDINLILKHNKKLKKDIERRPLSKIYEILIDQYKKGNKDNIVIDPRKLEVDRWSQRDYHLFWAGVIKSYVNKVVLFPGWQFSNGCVYEFYVAKKNNIRTVDFRGKIIYKKTGLKMIKNAIKVMNGKKVDIEMIKKIYFRIYNEI